MLAVSALDQGEVYYAGSSHLLDLPEFFDIDVTRTVLSLLDEDKSILGLFSKSFGDDPVCSFLEMSWVLIIWSLAGWFLLVLKQVKVGLAQ